VAFCLLPGTGATQADEGDYARIDQLVDQSEQRVIEWRHHIHQNPELGMREFNTAKLVADHLRSLGFDEVLTEVGKTGVVGVLKGGKPGDKVVALRADMDALPVKELSDVPFKSTVIDEDYPGGPFPVAHACGHDAHTAMLMGAAEVLAKMRDDIPGTVKLIFQPAEEGPPVDEPGGAALMVEEGVLENPRPDMVYALHVGPFPNGVIAYTPGTMLANSFLLRITITGEGVHGSTPWKGKDPMPVAAEIITAFGQVYRQEPAHDAFTLTIGKVEDEGRFNIIGGKVTLVGTLRVIPDRIVDDIKMRVERIAVNVAEAHGLTATVEWLQPVPALRNDPAWLERILPTVERVVGKSDIHQIPATLGYEDVSEFINPIGGAFMWLGAQDVEFGGPTGTRPEEGGKGQYVNHNPRFYVNDEVLKTGVRLFCNVVMDFLSGEM
jgi:amidohydrolase